MDKMRATDERTPPAEAVDPQSVRGRFQRALAGEPIDWPVYAVYDWFVEHRAIDWTSLFVQGLGRSITRIWSKLGGRTFRSSKPPARPTGASATTFVGSPTEASCTSGIGGSGDRSISSSRRRITELSSERWKDRNLRPSTSRSCDPRLRWATAE